MRFDILRLPSVTSSMDAARELAEQGAPEGTAVVADAQTAGRGRAGHAWFSPPGQSLHLSIILRPLMRQTLCLAEIGWVTMIAALAAKDEVGRMKDAASIKWFNDVQLNGRKVCGILVETSITGGELDYAVLGIGLNINTTFEGAPEDVRSRATSLRQEFGHDFDRQVVLDSLLARFGERYAALLAHRCSPAGEYARHVETLGRRVSIDTGNAVITGIAQSVNPDGSLVVFTDLGQRVVR